MADEEFSDRPACVCPVIGAFLRGWNDRAAYADRQRLRPYALRIVGTREADAVTRARRELCLEWVGAELHRGRARRVFELVRIRARIALFCGFGHALRLDDGAGEYAARVIFGRRDVDGAFVLLDAMLALGRPPAPNPHWPGANGNGHANGNGRADGNGSAVGNGTPLPAIRVTRNGGSVAPRVGTGKAFAPREKEAANGRT